MIALVKGMSARGVARLARWTVFGTLGCLAVSLSVNWLLFRSAGPEMLRLALLSASVLPVALAGPLFFFLSLKLRELAIANHKLSDLAAFDGLTGCLNRRAFAVLVDLRLKEHRAGMLLVIDADHFKAINDTYGHESGDAALRLIADAIGTSVRVGDAVGRLGGEEFGVYLPGTDAALGTEVAERIRSCVSSTVFVPAGGEAHRLSVSIGCALYEGEGGFHELFGLADRRLYAAKKKGRDRIELIDPPALAPALNDLGTADQRVGTGFSPR